METYWGVEVYLHAFLTSELDGGEWSDSRPGRFIPRERTPGTHWIGGWVGPKAVPDAVLKRNLTVLNFKLHLFIVQKALSSNYLDLCLDLISQAILDHIWLSTYFKTKTWMTVKDTSRRPKFVRWWRQKKFTFKDFFFLPQNCFVKRT
jgi:hypothetical protein